MRADSSVNRICGGAFEKSRPHTPTKPFKNRFWRGIFYLCTSVTNNGTRHKFQNYIKPVGRTALDCGLAPPAIRDHCPNTSSVTHSRDTFSRWRRLFVTFAAIPDQQTNNAQIPKSDPTRRGAFHMLPICALKFPGNKTGGYGIRPYRHTAIPDQQRNNAQACPYRQDAFL